RYEVSLREARRQNRGLRLKLRIRPPELAVLPWEFLYDAERDRYPSLSSKTPLVRYLDLPDPAEPVRVSPPLRVLGMVTSPRGLEPLNVEHEKRLVEEALRGLLTRGLVELTWLEGQTWRHLQRRMRLGEWHIFHFIGHGGFDPATEEGAIALAGEDDRLNLLRARSLAELLNDHYPLRLAFLNSCEGARGNNNDAFSSTAATLVRSGIPAVVAMQYEITDKAAIEFSRDFYEAVADGLPIDAAVTEARAAVSMDSMLEWGTPVLYMRSPDGRLFEIQKQASFEEDPLLRYRESLEAAWADGKLRGDEIEALGDLAAALAPDAAASVEREVMGDTFRGVLESQEQAVRERYRDAVEQVWTDDRLDEVDVDRLDTLAAELGLSAETAFKIESEVAGDAVRTILHRRATEEQERQQYLEELYHQGIRHLDAGEWRQALGCFEEVQRLEPGYRDTGDLLFEAREQLAYDQEEEEYDEPTGQRRRTSLDALGESWWSLALRGLGMGIFGLVLLTIFEAGDGQFRLYSATMIIADWVVATVYATTRSGRGRPLTIQRRISGLVGLSVLVIWFILDTSIVSSMNPDVQSYLADHIDQLALGPRLVGSWAIVVGIIRIVVTIRLEWETRNLSLMGVSGGLLVVFGLLLWVDSLNWWRLFGLLLLASGGTLVAFAFRVRSWQGSSTVR
ncbi:MAG: CHAT domain-containing protein, partial [Rubrobacter sp.]|nr:CHAT domain-containing protein [Rubrobacter sp.]